MNAQRLGTLIRLELLQRTRSVAWYVLLGVFAVLLLIVTAVSFTAMAYTEDPGIWIFSVVVYFTLLLVMLVSPTLSGNAINGDRDAAVLAPVQVTLATTLEILMGKFLAAWITGLAFVAVSVPFLIVATIAGIGSPFTITVSLLVMIVEIGVVAAIGVALSGILARPLFSVAVTYLVVAAFTVGTLIAFGLGGLAAQSQATNEYRSVDWSQYQGDTFPCMPGESPSADYPCDDDVELECLEWESYSYTVPRFDRVWWILAANPFVILADATPAQFDRDGYPTDLFGEVKFGVRSAQQTPELEQRNDECSPTAWEEPPTPEEIVATSAPSWFVGLTLQLLLAGGLLWWAWARTRTPATQLPPGTRIA
ncbi:ABC transporter permease [Microbacterium sp. C7(2022)]|uniref:ABC transporter permease n=1 Tax=Microbacterium sp. C7(2022) TaxID=2992759 RepID=UPI00237B457A|nr:ABC transporter permease [Microbacterium sp. C7(2022)]MDE0547664.1 ABC transporter permease [Microbacterium sp. C7(2022)]